MVVVFLAGIIVAVVVWAGWKMTRLKYLFLQKIISKKIIDKPSFSTLAVGELVRYILTQPKDLRRQLLKAVSENNFNQLLSLIGDSLLKAKINLMISSKVFTVAKPDALYYLMQANLCIKKNQFGRGVAILQKTSLPRADRRLKALKQFMTAQIALYEGDLLTASEETAAALKVFQKNDLLFEEAQAYFVLGTIYRVSGVFDSADFMLRSALKLFVFLAAPARQAEVLGTLGLLMAVQKRFAEAADYFNKAQELLITANDHENMGFILSQQAMLELLQNNFQAATKLARQALKKHKTIAGQALAADILARTAFVKNDWPAVIKYAKTAAEKYLHEHNYAAGFESRYLLAEAYTNSSLFAEAETILRELIRKEQYHKSCFHIANAYTLLGLVLLRQGHTSRAKVIFNQALNQELYNDRPIGIAIDYANLAAVAKKCGNHEEARKNLEKALVYAKAADEDLYARIRAVLD